VAHAYNPSYSGGKDQGITIRSQLRKIAPYLKKKKKIFTKKGLVEWLKV
jgi:hypothetical protein